MAGLPGASHTMGMSLTPAETSNRSRTLAALAGVGMILVWTLCVYTLNQANRPQELQVHKFELKTPVARAVNQRLQAWKLTGQHDPSVVKGLDDRMKSGMSALYVGRDRVRISTPDGCTLWIKQDKIVSATKQCLR